MSGPGSLEMPNLDDAQKKLSEQLTRPGSAQGSGSGRLCASTLLDPDLMREGVKESYLGAVYALQQNEHPDKFVHFAQSLREAIDQLARSNRFPECANPRGRDTRKKCLKKTFGRLGQQLSLDHLFDMLAASYGRLSEVAHHNERMSPIQAQELLSEVEGVLDQLTRPQLVIQAEIDKMLKEPPSLDSAARIVALQSRRATQSYTIDEMQDHWLPYARKAGFFKNPPPAKGPESEHERWLPAIYLRKCAKTFGKDVTDVILSYELADRPNPAVYVDFLICAADLTAARLEKVGRKALQEKWDRFMGLLLFAPNYVKVAEKLALNGRYGVATSMLLRALKPEPPGPAAGAAEPAAPAYVLEESLRGIAARAGKGQLPAIRLLDRLLRESVKDLGKDCEELAGADMDPGRNAAATASLLIGCLQDCVVRAARGRNRKRAMKVLHGGDHPVYRRMEMHAYAELPGRFGQEAELALLWHFGCACARSEYLRLLKAAFPALPEGAKRRVLDHIESHDPGTASGQDRADARATGQLQRLECLESIRAHLDPERRRLYEDLLKEFGPIRPDGAVDVSLGGGADPGTFDGKSPGEVFGIVEKYKQPELELADPADEFEAYVRGNPLECSRKAADLGSAHPRILHRLFMGLRDAVQNDERVEWGEVLRLIRDVALRFEQNRALGDSAPETESLRSALLPMFWLVEDGFKKDSLDFGLKESAWSVVEGLVKIGTADAEYHVKESSLTTSLNNLNGASFHAVYQYAAWCKRHDKSQALEEARLVFDEYLDGQDHTVSRHAVLGVFLPGLYQLDQEWAKRLPKKLQSSRKMKIAFWDGYISGNTMYSYAFEDLWKWYDEFMNKGILRGPDLAPVREATIRHVMLAYFYRLPKADAIVEKFLEKNDAEAVARYVDQTGPMLAGKGDDPEFDKTRLARLWRHPALKGSNLVVWFVASPLDRKTTITLYRDHVRQYPGKVDMSRDPAYTLDRYAKDYPSEAAECLEALVGKYPDGAVPDKARGVFEALCGCKDPQVRGTCERIAEKAAQRGLDWKELLPKV